MTRPLKTCAALAALMALTLSTAACGTSADSSEAASGGSDGTTVGSDTDPVDGEQVPAGVGCAEDDTATATGPVSVTDSFGRTVELNAPATRVAVLEWQQIEGLLSLCVDPVAVADVEGYGTWVSAEELPEGVVDVGTRGEPNIDALLGANPDLVIAEVDSADDALISQLEGYGIIVLATAGADATDPIAHMTELFRLIGDVTGRSERADVVVEEFETHLAEARDSLADDIDGLSTSEFVYLDGWMEGGNVALRPFGQGSLVGEIGEELGLTNAWTGEVDDLYGLGQTDIEGMTAVGDTMVLYTGTVDPAGDIIDELLENPVWAALPAVKADNVHAFPVGTWTFGGPRSTIQIIDAYVDVISG